MLAATRINHFVQSAGLKWHMTYLFHSDVTIVTIGNPSTSTKD